VKFGIQNIKGLFDNFKQPFFLIFTEDITWIGSSHKSVNMHNKYYLSQIKIELDNYQCLNEIYNLNPLIS
jgi:hypothetical protein